MLFNLSFVSLKPHPMQSSANTLLCKKEEEESATKYVKPSKLQALTDVMPDCLDGSTSHSCFNADLNDVDEIRRKMKFEPLVSNYKVSLWILKY